MKKTITIATILVAVGVIVGFGYGFFSHQLKPKSQNISKNPVLINYVGGGAWGGPTIQICRDGKIFSNKRILGVLDSNIIKYIEENFGSNSIEARYSHDIANTFDAATWYDLNYFGNEPTIKMQGSQIETENFGNSNEEKDQVQGDYQKLELFSKIINGVTEKITEKIYAQTKPAEFYDITIGQPIKVDKWTQAVNLFDFQNSKGYSMYPDNPFSNWPVLNEAQQTFINTLSFPEPTLKAKHNYFWLNGKIIDIEVNNSQGKVFISNYGYGHLVPADQVKPYIPEIAQTIIDNYNSPTVQRFKPVNKVPINDETTKLFRNNFGGIYLEQDGYYLFDNSSVNQSEQMVIGPYEKLETQFKLSVRNAVKAKTWTLKKDLFPFDQLGTEFDQSEFYELSYVISPEYQENQSQLILNDDQKNFVAGLAEGDNYFVVDNKLVDFYLNNTYQSVSLKVSSNDYHGPTTQYLQPADILSQFDIDFATLFNSAEQYHQQNVEIKKIISDDQKKLFNEFLTGVGFYQLANNEYSIVNTYFSVQPVITGEIMQLNSPSEFCSYNIDKSKLNTLSFKESDLEK